MYKTASRVPWHQHWLTRQESRTDAECPHSPLFPRTNASPYSFVLVPLTYSSVCSSAMFMYPSKQLRTPVSVRPQASEVREHGASQYRPTSWSTDEEEQLELTAVVDPAIQPDHDFLSHDTLEERARSWQLWLVLFRLLGVFLRGRRTDAVRVGHGGRAGVLGCARGRPEAS